MDSLPRFWKWILPQNIANFPLCLGAQEEGLLPTSLKSIIYFLILYTSKPVFSPVEKNISFLFIYFSPKYETYTALQ